MSGKESVALMMSLFFALEGVEWVPSVRDLLHVW